MSNDNLKEKPMANRSYNILRDLGVDDMEYIEDLDLDESLAYTPEINDAILDKIAENNYDSYLDEGQSESKAKELTRVLRDRGQRIVNNTLEERKKGSKG